MNIFDINNRSKWPNLKKCREERCLSCVTKPAWPRSGFSQELENCHAAFICNYDHYGPNIVSLLTCNYKLIERGLKYCGKFIRMHITRETS